MKALEPGLVKWILTPFVFCLASCLFGQTSVLTQHNDLSRTGQNLNETILTPSTVASGNFKNIFSLTVDGAVLAQPLYVPGVTVGGVAHNVVFIATEHDSVYAFDADSGGVPLWKASMLDTAHGAASGATTNPESQSGCHSVNGEYGISGTPVIDPATGTLYVLSVTYENDYPVNRLHALDLTSGLEKLGGPVAISASTPGSGSGSSNGTLTFDPGIEADRAGLALANGQVYVSFASYCDLYMYHGWLLAYNAATLAQTAVFVTTPNGLASGIWMGAAAPSVDTENGVTRMFISTGNGTYDATTPYATNSMDYGDDILRLDVSHGITVVDAFTPFNQATLSAADADLGSTGPLILPDQPGAYPHLLVETSKLGVIYLVNRDNLGGYSTTTDNVVQELNQLASSEFGSPAYWNSNIYFWPAGGQLRQFSLTNGLLSATPIAFSPQLQNSGLGSSPSISANGTTNAIVWSIDSSQSPQVLYAHDAINVSNLLWSSAMNPTRDSAGQPVKFLTPTIANGKVYVDSIAQVLVYGLPDFSLKSAAALTTVVQGQTATNTISINPLYGFTGTVTFSASNLPPAVTTSFAANAATFTAAANATPGNYSVLITGSSDTLSHSVSVGLTVATPPPPPDFGVALSPQSLTLTAGTSGTAQISVTPNQTFNGAVSFACSVASSLTNVTCSVPGVVTGSGSATLTITAGASAATPLFRPLNGNRMLLFLIAGLLFTSAAAWFHNRSKGRLIGVAFTMLLVVCFCGCGGGGISTSLPAAKAVSETGLITVVGTSGSLSHSTTISVTIQ